MRPVTNDVSNLPITYRSHDPKKQAKDEIFLKGTKTNSRKQLLNLKQLLVKSKFTNETEGTVSKCDRKRCVAYEHLIVGNSFRFTSSNYLFKVKHDMDCNSK